MSPIADDSRSSYPTVTYGFQNILETHARITMEIMLTASRVVNWLEAKTEELAMHRPGKQVPDAFGPALRFEP